MATPAKRSSAKARVAPQVTAADADSVTPAPRFGVLIEMGGQTIPVSGSWKDIKTKGLDISLQNPVTLGSLADFETWVKAQTNIDLDSILNGLPPFLQKVKDSVVKMVWTVEHAHLNIPPTGTGATGVKYTIEVNGEFAEAVNLDLFQVKGVVFGASNETPAAPSTPSS